MAKVIAEFDTVDKTLSVSINGKAVADVYEVNFCRGYADDDEAVPYRCGVMTLTQDADEGITTMNRVMAPRGPRSSSRRRRPRSPRRTWPPTSPPSSGSNPVFHPPVYRAEIEAGLADQVRARASVAYATALRLTPDERVDRDRLLALARSWSKASTGDFDLHPLDFVIATTNWNNNDDVFDRVETFVARKTPEHKQLNVGHQDSKIVGHIITSAVVTADFQPIAEDAATDDLPDKFHLVGSGVLYKSWQTPELQEEMDKLLASIAAGKTFVSMECLFKGFDYAMRATDGSTRVVARNEKTAHLTKALRAYGGKGVYGEYRVGRLLRNIVFSGTGLVTNPANPESVILNPNAEAFASSRAILLTDFQRLGAESVYPAIVPASPATENEMTVTVETLQVELAAAKAKISELEAGKHAEVINDLKATLEAEKLAKATLEQNAAKLATESADLKAAADKALAEANAKVEDLAKKLTAAEAAKAELDTKFAAIEADKAKAERTALVKDKLKLDADKAAAYVAANDKLSAEDFAKAVEFLAVAFLTNNPQSGTTTHSGPAAQEQPKGTPAPLAPKGTPAPLPTSEADETGARAAEATDLAAAAAQVEPSLSTVEAPAGVSEVNKAIAEFLGANVDEN
jgi:hypothetical protein